MASFKLIKKEPIKKFKLHKKLSFHISKKSLGIVLVVLSLVTLLILVTNFIWPLKSFILGTFGLSSFVYALIAFFVGFAFINNKKYIGSKLYVLYLTVALISIQSVIDLSVYHGFSGGYGAYLANSYNMKMTAGGIIIGFLTSILRFTIFEAGAFVVAIMLLIISGALIFDYYRYSRNSSKYLSTASIGNAISSGIAGEDIQDESQKIKQPKKNVKITLNAEVEDVQSLTDAKSLLGLNRKFELKSDNITDQLPPIFEKNNKGKATDKDLKSYLLSKPDSYYFPSNNIKKTEIDERFEKLKGELPINQAPKKVVHDNVVNLNNAYDLSLQSMNLNNSFESNIKTEDSVGKEMDSINGPDEFLSENAIEDLKKQALETINCPKSEDSVLDNKIASSNLDKIEPSKKEKNFVQIDIENDELKVGGFHNKINDYIAPPLEIFTTKSIDPSEFNTEVEEKREMLEKALETFKIPAKVLETVIGPAVTRYELEMPMGISVKKVSAHHDDIALALAANGDIRIEAPIPGKSAVGIEVPNEKIATVSIKEILASREFNLTKAPLAIALGKDINGQIKICDLSKMPHLLVAGSTNSGKSVCLNTALISLIQKLSPSDLKLILIDPKRVEFSMYNNLPHLIMPKVICDSEKAINALIWAVNEMEKRYIKLENARSRNIDEYNARPEVVSGKSEKMCYIVIIIDELADLMTSSKREVEESLIRLAQKSRAAGIHMIVATQRPSVDVVTGLIKTNFPSRISFALTCFADSKTILDQGGADKLLGKGDMLYKPVGASNMSRIQGCFMTGTEVENYVNFVIDNNKDFDFDSKIEQEIINMRKNTPSDLVDGKPDGEMFDDLFKQALKLVIENGQASITVIQRKMQVGYPRAARIIDQMEQAGYISASDGSKPRTIFITIEEYKEIFGNC